MKPIMFRLFLLLQLTGILVITPFVSEAQSLEDTQTWIKEKIESFALRSPEYKHNYTVEFDDEEIIISNLLWTNIMGIRIDLNYKHSLPLKNVRFRFTTGKSKDGVDYVHLKFLSQNGQNLIKSEYEGEPIKWVDEYYISLDSAFNEDDLINRMTKALNHLIKLKGGAVPEETF